MIGGPQAITRTANAAATARVRSRPMNGRALRGVRRALDMLAELRRHAAGHAGTQPTNVIAPPRHVLRSTSIGSTRVARRPGTYAAVNATTTSSSATVANAAGS